MGFPSCSQLMSCTGWPDIIHWNWASLSTSTVCTWGCKWAVNGAGIINTKKIEKNEKNVGNGWNGVYCYGYYVIAKAFKMEIIMKGFFSNITS